ncbi:MAG: cobalamin-binding protein [Deltaproteobacteria bacterium]|nr:MAG: cobalamin-binding protein [Deltaproteobacteria bacterium]
MSYLEEIQAAIIEGKHAEIEAMVSKLIEEDVDLNDLINKGMIAAMDVVGERFASGQIFVPEMLVSAMTMKKGLNLIRPLLKAEEAEPKATIVMCTVKGDIHDIGKNLVIMMLEGAGFRVIDLGVDLSVDDLITRVMEIKPNIIGLSALLTTTMPEMKKVIAKLEENGLRDTVKIMVGGAPVDRKFANMIGADGYGEDAAQAVRLARSFVVD